MSEQQPPAPPRRARTVLWVTIAIVVAVAVGGGATALVLTSGVSRSGDGHATTESRLAAAAAERDEVQEAAERGAVVMNTLDYRDVEAGLDEWESVATGDLLDEIRRGREKSVTAIVNAKSVTEAEVLSSAVAELNDDAGTATALVAIQVATTTDGSGPTNKFLRLEVALERTKDGWKLSEISQVTSD